MRKYLSLFLLFIGFSLSGQEILRFERRVPEVIRESESQKATNNSPEESFSYTRKEPVWKRIIYRELDLIQPENAPLYYPVIPLGERQNLTTVILDAVCAGSLPVYEYLDGYELFEKENCLPVGAFLKHAGILYETEESDPGNIRFLVDRNDYPSGDIRTYYVKECWYVDPLTSRFLKEIIAVCPLLSAWEENQLIRIPLGWFRYNELSPFIRDKRIMASDLNNTWRYTMDEFFRQDMYKGEIIKTENLMNKTLRELYANPDSLRIAQEEIEKQLKSLKKSLYWYPDSTKTDKKQVKKQVSVTPAGPAKSVSTEEHSAPVRSVRRR